MSKALTFGLMFSLLALAMISGVSAYQEAMSQTGVTNVASIIDDSSTTYGYYVITANETMTVDSLAFGDYEAVGTLSGSMYYSIWTVNGSDYPLTQIAETIDNFNLNDVSVSQYDYFKLNFAPGAVNLTNGTKYALVYRVTWTGDGSNYLNWHRDNSGGDGCIGFSADTVTWTQACYGYRNYRLYKSTQQDSFPGYNLINSFTTSNTGPNVPFRYSSSYQYAASCTNLTTTTSFDMAQVHVAQINALKQTSIGAGDIWLEMYSYSSGPNAQIAVSSNTFPAQYVSGAGEYVLFNFSSPVSLTQNQIYCFVVKGNNSLDSSNYLRTVDGTEASSTEYVYDGASWNLDNSGNAMNYRLFQLPATYSLVQTLGNSTTNNGQNAIGSPDVMTAYNFIATANATINTIQLLITESNANFTATAWLYEGVPGTGTPGGGTLLDGPFYFNITGTPNFYVNSTSLSASVVGGQEYWLVFFYNGSYARIGETTDVHAPNQRMYYCGVDDPENCTAWSGFFGAFVGDLNIQLYGTSSANWTAPASPVQVTGLGDSNTTYFDYTWINEAMRCADGPSPDGRLYCYDDNGNTWPFEIVALNTTDLTWTELADGSLVPYVGGYSVSCHWYRSNMYCVSSDSANLYTTIYNYSSNSVSVLSSIATGFNFPGDCDLRPGTDEMYCWGDMTYYGDLYKYDIGSDAWTYLGQYQYAGATGAKWPQCNFRNVDEFWCAGGEISGALPSSDILVINVNTNATSQKLLSWPDHGGLDNGFGYYGLINHQCRWHNDKYYCYAGDDNNIPYSYMSYYDATADTNDSFEWYYGGFTYGKFACYVLNATADICLSGAYETGWSVTTQNYLVEWLEPLFIPVPVANFTADVTNGTDPLSVQFGDLSTGYMDIMDFSTGATGPDNYYGYNSVYNWTCTQYIPSLTYYLGAFGADIRKQGSPTGIHNLILRYGDPTNVTGQVVSSDYPESLLPSAFGGEYPVFMFPTNPQVVAGEVYWICTQSTTPENNVNHFYWEYGGSNPAYFETNGYAALGYNYKAYKVDYPVSWAWDFQNDGVVDNTTQNPIFAYSSPGNYTVNLTVANAGGSDAEVKVNYIQITAVPPVANFTANQTNGTAPLSVQFTDTSTNLGNEIPEVSMTPLGYNFSVTAEYPCFSAEGSPDGNIYCIGFNINSYSSLYRTNQSTMALDYVIDIAATNNWNADGFWYGDSLYIVDKDPHIQIYNSTSNTSSVIYYPTSFIDESACALDRTQGIIYCTALNVTSSERFLWKYNISSNTSSIVSTFALPNSELWADSQGCDYSSGLLFCYGGNTNLGLRAFFEVWNVTSGTVSDFNLSSNYYDTALGAYGTRLIVLGDMAYYPMSETSDFDGSPMLPYFNVKTMQYGYFNDASLFNWPSYHSCAKYSDFQIQCWGIYNGTLNDYQSDRITLDFSQWKWDFQNDGVVDSNVRNPTYVYSTPGTYTVNLTVANAGGSDAEVKVNYIQVTAGVVAPVANFTANQTSGYAPLSVQFNDTSTNTPTSWAWDFENDGIIDSTSQTPGTYVFSTPGTYTVNLTVSNGGGSDSEVKTSYITVLSVSPYIDFAANVTNGMVPLSVQFTSLGLMSGLVSYLPMNDTNPNVAADVWGSSSLTGTGVTINSRGKNFDSSVASGDNYVGASDPSKFNLSLSSDWTLGFYFSRDPTGATNFDVMTKLDQAGACVTDGWEIFSLSGDLRFIAMENCWTNDDEWVISYPNSELHYVVIVHNASAVNGSKIKFYVDGVEQSVSFSRYGAQVTSITNNWNFTVGSDSPDYPGTGNETVKELTYYSRMLNSSEIVALARNGGNPLSSLAWDFQNDGVVDNTTQNPLYVYSSPGTYTVNLTAINSYGSDTEVKLNYITVNAVPVPYSISVAAYNNSIRAPYTASNVSSSPVLYGDYYLRNSSSAWEAAGLMSGLRYYQSFDDYNASNRWYDVPAEVGKGGHTSCSFGANTAYAFMTCPNIITGKQGNAVQTYTTGFNPFWRTNLNAELNSTDSYTISFWANFSNTAGGDALIFSDQDTVSNSSAIKWYISNTGGNYLNLYFNNNVFQATLFSNFTYFQTTNVWRHFVITHDRGANRFLVYVDGLLGANVSAGAISTITEIQPMIGGYPNGGVMDGVWDEAAVWNRVLNASERSSLYNSGTGLFYANHEAVDASTYKWYKNGAVVAGQTGRTLSSSYYGAPGALDAMIFEVTPVDTVYGSGTPVNSSIITIQGPPATTITTLATCPATVYPNELDLPSVAYGVYNFSVLALPSFANESYTVGIMNQPVTCSYVSVNSTYRTYNCTFPIHFYQAAGAYNLQVNYTSNGYVDQENVSSACTVGQLLATQRLTNTISFPGAGPGIANVESNVPVVVRNTGNVQVDLAMTAYNLQGTNNPGILLNASSFKSGSSLGSAVALAHGVQKNLSMSLPVGVNSTANIRLWLTMGSTQAVQDYYSVIPWQIISLS